MLETGDASPTHHLRGNISSLIPPPTLELSFLPRSHHIFSPKALCIAEVLNFLPKRAALSAAPYQDKSTWQRALHYAASATRRAALETPRRGPSSAPAGVPGLPFLVLPALGCSRRAAGCSLAARSTAPSRATGDLAEEQLPAPPGHLRGAAYDSLVLRAPKKPSRFVLLLPEGWICSWDSYNSV